MEYLYNPLATKLIRNIERMMFVEQIGERVLTKTQRRFINYVMAGSRSLPAITLIPIQESITSWVFFIFRCGIYGCFLILHQHFI
jgi:hypothetical protein